MIWPLAAGLARLLPAETAHRVAVKSLQMGIGPAPRLPAMPVLALGLEFGNPLGLAAGFDKDAEAMGGVLATGFGHMEVGTITPLAQPGNPRPRVFRLPADQAVINRYGFNSQGIAAARPRLAGFRKSHPAALVGVNIGANKLSDDRIADYHRGAAALAGEASWITVNISSPNTPGLRDLQQADSIQAILNGVRQGMAEAGKTCPILVKLAPDMPEAELKKLLDSSMAGGCDGFVLTNTTLSRPASLASPAAVQTGGLSGAPLRDLAAAQLGMAARHLAGAACLVGVGGIASPADAYARLLAGANLVQLYSALALQGPDLPAAIIAGLGQMMKADGVADLAELTRQIMTPSQAQRHAEDLWQRSSAQKSEN